MPCAACTRRSVLSLVLAASFTAGALALPFAVPVNQSQSSLTFDLCVVGKCDTKSSPVTGLAIIELDSVDIPTQITLYDFYFHLTNNMNWTLSWSILGSLTASATNVTVLDALPGMAQQASMSTPASMIIGSSGRTAPHTCSRNFLPCRWVSST